jgi:hypothetical protein
MRDIRDELRERRRTVDARYADETALFIERSEALRHEHRVALESLTKEREAIDALIAIEDRRLGGVGTSPLADRTLAPLGDFILATVCSQGGPMGKEAIKAEAEAVGYFADGSNGRTFHTTLMNLVKHGKLVWTKGAYEARRVPSYPLFQGDSINDGDTRPLM